jgi:glycerophosphoryl diester phosphodiesterase
MMWLLPLAVFTLFTEVVMAACPLLIAHRGASGHRPEHTLAAYELAIAQGADFLEVDVVATRDGVLVARHENELTETTDVASRQEFAGRKASKLIDGARRSGWFVEDFNLEELKRLRAIERIPAMRPQNQAFDGLFTVPTLQEVIDLARGQSRLTGHDIGLYLETKHPTYFRSIGLPLEEALAEVLGRNDYRTAADPVFLESFEPSSLRTLKLLTRLRLVQLLGSPDERPYDFAVHGDSRTTQDLLTPAGLAEVAQYASVLGMTKAWFHLSDESGRAKASAFIRDAHRRGLQVHVWTLRNENYFLPDDLRAGNPSDVEFPRRWGDTLTEYQRYFRLDIDGVFTDFPATARQALAEYQKTSSCR